MPKPDTNPSKVNSNLQAVIQGVLSDRPIAYHPILAQTVGSVTAGIFLSQLLYWTPRSQNQTGWIWKTRDEIFNETALGRREQETARRILRDTKVLEERLSGVPARLHFRVNMERLIQLLSSFQTDQTDKHPLSQGAREGDPSGLEPAQQAVQLGGIRPTSWPQSAQQAGPNLTNKEDSFRPAISESTSKTTSESTRISKPREVSKLEQNNSQSRPTLVDIEDSTLRPVPTKSESRRMGGFTAVGDVVASKIPRRPRLEADEDFQVLQAYVEDLSREFDDRASLKTSTTRAYNLFRQSQLNRDNFIARMLEARAITKNRTHTIRSQSISPDHPFPIKHKMAFYFACLEDLLGLRKDKETSSEAARAREATTPESPPRSPQAGLGNEQPE